jgi:hypothetical protein
MPIELIIESAQDFIKAHREQRATAVIDRFGGHLPDRQLLCFLDSLDWDQLKQEVGMANRGLFFLTSGFRVPMPTRLLERVLPVDQSLPEFEEVIYLHGTTCKDDIGLTMTFAHELQHFVQHAASFDLWLIGTLMINALNREQLNKIGIFKWADVPHELEARIVSKRIAQDLFGEKKTDDTIRQRVDEAVNAGDRTDWEFIRTLPVDEDFNLSKETLKILPRLRPYKLEFQRLFNQNKGVPGVADFNLGEWLT